MGKKRYKRVNGARLISQVKKFDSLERLNIIKQNADPKSIDTDVLIGQMVGHKSENSRPIMVVRKDAENVIEKLQKNGKNIKEE